MDLSGKTIAGRFDVQERLARGAGQSIYLATDTDRGDRCYVTSCSPPRDPEACARAIEFDLPGVAELRHHGAPLGISDAYSLVEAEPAGRPLAARVEGPVDPGVSAGLIRELAEVVTASHELRGTGLPGLHPLTVYGVDRGGVMCLGGAFVRHTVVLPHTSTEWKVPVYSLHFESREVLLGIDKARSPAADVYTLGALLAWLLSGRFPFAGATMVEVVRAHVLGSPHGCVVPAVASKLVEAALSPPPSERPSLAGLLRALSEL